MKLRDCVVCPFLKVSARLLGVKRFPLIKERFRLEEKLRRTRCSPSVFKAYLITARAGKFKRTAPMLANAYKDQSIPAHSCIALEPANPPVMIAF